MDEAAAERAARLLIDARAGRVPPLAALPADCAPQGNADAHQIQDTTAAILGESTAAMKVAIRDGEVQRGLILASRIMASPATVPAAMTRLCGIEAEIAFRLDRELPRRESAYTPEEVADAVTAMVVIEVVDSGLILPDAAPFDRGADFMCNGGLVTGTVRDDWRTIDLVNLEVVVSVGGAELKRCKASHVAGDPLLPAVALINMMAPDRSLPAGLIITTGTYSGLDFVRKGDVVKVDFIDFGEAEVTFEA